MLTIIKIMQPLASHIVIEHDELPIQSIIEVLIEHECVATKQHLIRIRQKNTLIKVITHNHFHRVLFQSKIMCEQRILHLFPKYPLLVPLIVIPRQNQGVLLKTVDFCKEKMN